MYGNLEGTPVASATSASASDCCDSCKGTAGCNAWNFCYCDLGCAGEPKGTCVLKTMTNPFYPRCESFLCHTCMLVTAGMPLIHISLLFLHNLENRMH